MKKIALLLSVLLTVVFLPIACTDGAEPRTKYVIAAEYDGNRRINAHMTVDYYNDTGVELDEIMFHLYPRAYREGATFSPVAAKEYSAHGDLSVLGVTVNGESCEIRIIGQDDDILAVSASVEPTRRVSIGVDFCIELPIVKHRFGLWEGAVNLGNWFPILCAYKNGFDTHPYYANGDPFDSGYADFEVSITVPQKFSVAVGGDVSENSDGEKKTVSSALNNARDFAAVIGEWKCAEKTVGKTAVRYYYREGEANKILGAAEAALTTYSELFGEYAYDSLAIVKTPFLQGGMEYPALVYISDDLNEEMSVEVTAHEIAHQWWYAAVGNNQVEEAWLDEALAEYSTTVFYENNPSYGVTRDDRVKDALRAYLLYVELYKDNGKADTSMNRRVNGYINSMEYTYMTYVKGQLMLDELRNLIGDEAFFGALKQYYADYMYKIAHTDCLIAAFEKSSARELKGFFDAWLRGDVKMFAA